MLVNNIGRPFTVDGNARFANVARIDGWSEPCTLDALGDLPKELRAEIARAWADAGAHEHASIASFARFMMDLMSLGAPRELIEATTQAIADETRHATRCFSIASAFAGCSLGPEEVDKLWLQGRQLENESAMIYCETIHFAFAPSKIFHNSNAYD